MPAYTTSNLIEPLIKDKKKGQNLWFDAGYAGKEKEKEDEVTKCGMLPIICEKGHRNHPLTNEQKKSNREKSHTRRLIEHIFGFMEGAMNGSVAIRLPLSRRLWLLYRENYAQTCQIVKNSMSMSG